MGTTTTKGVPYPVPSDPPDVPADMGLLASWVDGAPGVGIFTTSQRDALAFPALWAGRTIYNTTTGRVEAYTAIGWLPVGGYVQALNQGQRDALPLKPAGFTVFNTDAVRLQTYDGNRWQDYGFMPNLTTTQRDALTAGQKLVGQIIWNTTNGVHEAWNGTTWGQIAGGSGSAGAAGIVGLATASGSGATSNVTVATVTFAGLPGRRYDVSGWVSVNMSATGSASTTVKDGASNIQVASDFIGAATGSASVPISATVATGATARTITITVQVSANTGTFSVPVGLVVVTDVGADSQVATPIGIVAPNVWNTAWGAVLAPQVLAADSGAAGSSYATVGGFIATATLYAGRRYKVKCVGTLLKPGAGTGTGRFQFRVDSGATGSECLVWLVVNGYQAFIHELDIVGDGASHSITAQIRTDTDTVKLVAFSVMTVEDIGPVNPAAPATWTPNPLPGPWVTVTALLNGWVNFGAPYQVAQYRLVGDVVQVRGIIKNGTATLGTVLFNLPAGYAPPASIQFAQISNNLFGAIEIRSDGSVVILAGSTAALSIAASFSTVT